MKREKIDFKKEFMVILDSYRNILRTFGDAHLKQKRKFNTSKKKMFLDK